MIELGHISHPGKKRLLNEDSYDVDLPQGLALVVDGMGGANAGDIASAFVREQLRKNILQGDDPADALKNAGQALRIQRPQQGGSPSGASAAVLTWKATTFSLAWVGPCRAYFFDGQSTAMLCPPLKPDDKSSATTLSATSVQALGVTATDKLQVHALSSNWEKSQAILLCSDGLLEECRADLLHEVISNRQLSAQEAVEHLLLNALQGTANNNITAVLLRRN